MTGHRDALETWHHLVQSHDPRGLETLIAEDAIFHSPVVHTPQVGKAITVKYLRAAFDAFFNPSFRYVRELRGPREAMLEFQVDIDGIAVNGIDLITWNDAGKIVEFKVMLRPLKAVHLMHQKMGELLQREKSPAG